MIKGLGHIGVVVRSIDSSAGIFSMVLDAKQVQKLAIPEMKVTVAFFDVGPVTIELIEALGEGSPVEKFLDEKGEGLHHLCFKVDNVEEKLAQLAEAGVVLINDKPRIGAHGKKIAFVHPKSVSGVLIELEES